MIQVYKPENKNYENNGDCVLHPKKCELTMQLNGEWDMDIECAADALYIECLKAGSVITAPTPYGENEQFRVYDVEKEMGGLAAKARPIFFDASRETHLKDVRPTQCTVTEAAEKISVGKYRVVSDITDINTAYYVRKNLIEALLSDNENSFINRWGGEPIFQNYVCQMRKRAGGDYGAEARLGFNMSSVKAKVNMDNVVTRIIPESYNGYTLPDDSYYVDSPNIGKYPIAYTKVAQYEDVKLQADCRTDETGYATLEDLQKALREKAKADFEAGCDLPEITYEVDLINIENTIEYADVENLVKIGLGDYVKVENKDLQISTRERAVSVVWDCIMKRNTTVTLGSAENDYLDRISAAMKMAELALNKDGTVKGDQVTGMINLMKTRLKATAENAEKQAAKAILFEELDKNSDLYGAMALGTTGFLIASERTPDGRDWDWKTFGTGQGFLADYLIAGVLLSQNYKDGEQGFKLDLNSGKIFASLLEIFGKEAGKPCSVALENGRILVKESSGKSVIQISPLQNVNIVTGKSTWSGMIGKGNTFIEVNPQDDYIRFRAGAIYEGYSGSAGLSGKLVYSDESYLVIRNGRITGGRIKKSDGTWEELKNGTN